MIRDLTSFSTVFQSYQEKGRVVMKCCVQWNPVRGARTRAGHISRQSLNLCSNPDGSFTTAISNSFLGPLEKT